MGEIEGKYKSVTIFLAIAFAEGILVAILFFLEPSLDHNVFIWGFSKTRLIVGGILLGAVLVWGILLLISIFKKYFTDNLIKFIFLNKINYLIGFFISIYIILIIFFIDFIFPYSKFQQFNFSGAAALQRFLPSVIWAILLVLQSFFFVRYRFLDQLKQIKKDINIPRWILAFLSVLFTSFLWLSLLYQINFKIIHPNWYYLYELKSLSIRGLIVALMLVLSWILINYIFRSSHKTFIKLFVLIGFGYILQVSYGFIAGGGFEFLQYYYAEAFISLSVDNACQGFGTFEIVKEYEKLFSSGFWTGTKPPGFVLLYTEFGKFAKFINQENFIKNCRTGFIEVGSYILPLLSLIVLIPLTELSKKFLNKKDILVPALLYIFTPNVILMTQVPDQVVYPLLFTFCIYLIYELFEKHELWLSIVIGIYLYICIFFSFSLLPVLGLFLFWFLIDLCIEFKTWSFNEIIKVLSGVGGSLIGMHYIFIIFLNYNVISRYQFAFANHREIKNINLSIKQVLNVLILNNIEFSMWVGIPIILLAIVALTRLLLSENLKLHTKKFIFPLTFFMVYVGLNIIGQTKAEVARLWLFMVPGFMLLAGPEVLRLIPGSKKGGLFLIVFLQYLSSFWIFHYFPLY